ncbi:MAG: ATP-binding protein, partial [Pseudomonadota bacterium]
IESIPRNLPYLKCAPNEITEALLTVLVNAIEAVVKDCEPNNRRIRIEIEHIDGKIVIAISDNGNGVSSEIEDRIFDPFFTTKEVGSGSGLGLSSARGLVEKHSGSITLQTGGGLTCFRVVIPCEAAGLAENLANSSTAA